MKANQLTDEDLANRFESFDVDSAAHAGRDPVLALQWAAQLREFAERQLADVVGEARASGATWAQIGTALGISHQAAMKRYKRTA